MRVSQLYYSCCVCKCTRRDAVLHHFPCTAKRLKKWLQCLTRDDLNQLSVKELSKLFVCQKHFEKKFITPRSHLTGQAYPSLFTEGEIASGIPAWKYTTIATGTIRANVAHNDHSYSIGSSATQYTEIIIKEKKTPEELANDLRTPDNTKEATDNLIDASAAEASGFEDGINDNDFDDGCPQPTVPELEEVQEPIFSWQKDTDWLPTEIMDDNNDSIVCPSVCDAVDLSGGGECSMYCDDEPATGKRRDETLKIQTDPIEIPELPTEYQCNECRKEIVGFRYTCVQCADWDLCGACEARTAHATHYVLRVPSPRPYNEIQAVLAAIRQQLLSENLFLNQEFVDDSLKVEVKDEPGEEPPAAPDPAPAPEPDPLEEPHSDYQGDNTHTEDSSEDSDVSSSPRHKLRSHRKLRSDKTKENTETVTRDKPVLANQDGAPMFLVQDDATMSTVQNDATMFLVQNDATMFLVQDDATMFTVQDDATMFTVQNDATMFTVQNDATMFLVQDDATIFAVQDDATMSDHIDLTETVSDNATRISTDKPILNSELSTMKKPYDTRMYTFNNPNKATIKLAPINPNIIAENFKNVSVDNPARKSYENVAKSLQKNPAISRVPADNARTKIADINPTRRKLATTKVNKPTSLLATDSSTRQIVQNYLTKAKHKTGNVAETLPIADQFDDVIYLDDTIEHSDDVICLEDTNTSKSADRLDTEIVSNVESQASQVSDRVEGCLESNEAQTKDEIVLRLPSDTNEVDLARALQSKVTVRLERLQVEVMEFVPAKKRLKKR